MNQPRAQQILCYALFTERGVARSAAIAFLGHSGLGKSTMATALLHRREHRALADDTIALPAPQSDAPLLLYPSLPHLKLRAPSVEAFGENPAHLPRWHPDDDSFVLRLSPTRSHEPAPLRCFYVLEDSPTLSVERLPLSKALLFLLRHAYSMGLLPDSELSEGFQACVRLARHVPVFLLRRPKDFERLPEVVRLVEEFSWSQSEKGFGAHT